MEWHENTATVLGLGFWLHHECCAFDSVSQVLYFFAKPWKWQREYELWRKFQKAPTEEERELLRTLVQGEGTCST